jgi:hypothetical protein
MHMYTQVYTCTLGWAVRVCVIRCFNIGAMFSGVRSRFSKRFSFFQRCFLKFVDELRNPVTYHHQIDRRYTVYSLLPKPALHIRMPLVKATDKSHQHPIPPTADSPNIPNFGFLISSSAATAVLHKSRLFLPPTV